MDVLLRCGVQDFDGASGPARDRNDGRLLLTSFAEACRSIDAFVQGDLGGGHFRVLPGGRQHFDDALQDVIQRHLRTVGNLRNAVEAGQLFDALAERQLFGMLSGLGHSVSARPAGIMTVCLVSEIYSFPRQL